MDTTFQKSIKSDSFLLFDGCFLSFDGNETEISSKDLLRFWREVFVAGSSEGYFLENPISLVPRVLIELWSRDDIQKGFPLLLGDPSSPRISFFIRKIWRDIDFSRRHQKDRCFLITPFKDQGIWEIEEDCLIPFKWESEPQNDDIFCQMLEGDTKKIFRKILTESLEELQKTV